MNNRSNNRSSRNLKYMVILWENYEKQFYTSTIVTSQVQANRIANDFRRRRSRRADIIQLG